MLARSVRALCAEQRSQHALDVCQSVVPHGLRSFGGRAFDHELLQPGTGAHAVRKTAELRIQLITARAQRAIELTFTKEPYPKSQQATLGGLGGSRKLSLSEGQH